MPLKLYNTLTRKKENFKPIHKDFVGVYSCGPTVYNYAHIGNLRTYIFNDILKRSLLFLNFKVKHVINITDVDDKTIKGSVREGTSLKEFTRKYEKIFFDDLKELNIIRPEYVLRATESISDMIKLIEVLIKKDYAYKTSDGIYFNIKKFKNYGKLAQLDKIKDTMARISADEYDKENAQDFALWKFYSEEDGDVFWNAPFGKGRPGWHIECSAMSSKILGETFDIHTGAIDLIFPHHTNEIAQSEAASGKKFVNYWMHAGFLTMKEGKMSKSLGNVFYLKNIKERGFSAMDYRYMCLTTHYRSALQFSVDNLEAAKNSYSRLKNIVSEIKDDGKDAKNFSPKNFGATKFKEDNQNFVGNEKYLSEFKKAIEDDLDMPKALQILWKLVRDEDANGKLRTIKKIDEVFGLKLLENEDEIINEIINLSKEDIDLLFYNCKWIDKNKGKNMALPDSKINNIKQKRGDKLINTFIQETGINIIKKELENLKIPNEIKKLIKEREQARKNKDWKRSDEIREKIKEKGFYIDDTKEGSRVRKI